ncbi:MAG: efflux RND transporter periplasmic adaptor subunit [Planctomycetota bacterium]
MPNTKTSRLRTHLPAITRAAVAVLALGGALGLYKILENTKAQPTRASESAGPPLVRAVGVVQTPLARPWTGYGTVAAMSAARVSTQVAGRVVERPETVEAGLPVRRGQLLARIDPTDFEQRVESWRAIVATTGAQIEQLDIEQASLDRQLTLAIEEADIAQRDYDRARRVFEERGGGAPTELDQRLSALRRIEREVATLRERSQAVPTRRAALDATLRSQQADLRLAREQLGRTRVVAPIDGVLQTVALDEGDFASVGQEVARVVDLSRLEVPLSLPVSAANAIRVGDRASITLDLAGGPSWSGTIARLAPEADAETRTLPVFVEVRQDVRIEDGRIAAADDLLRPGQFVTGIVVSSRAEPSLAVPRRAIVDGAVLVARANSQPTVRRVEVESLFTYEGRLPGAPAGETQWVVVRGSLDPAARVIVSNLDELRGGMAIRLDPADAASAAIGGAP